MLRGDAMAFKPVHMPMLSQATWTACCSWLQSASDLHTRCIPSASLKAHLLTFAAGCACCGTALCCAVQYAAAGGAGIPGAGMGDDDDGEQLILPV